MKISILSKWNDVENGPRTGMATGTCYWGFLKAQATATWGEGSSPAVNYGPASRCRNERLMPSPRGPQIRKEKAPDQNASG